MPIKSKFLTVIDVCSTFFSIPVDEVNQYFFVLTWRKKKFTWTVMPQGLTESFLFPRNPEGQPG